jgi:valyl-tRNA synthetase
LNASEQDVAGQSAPGRDGGDKDGEKKVKSEKEREDPVASIKHA